MITKQRWNNIKLLEEEELKERELITPYLILNFFNTHIVKINFLCMSKLVPFLSDFRLASST